MMSRFRMKTLQTCRVQTSLWSDNEDLGLYVVYCDALVVGDDVKWEPSAFVSLATGRYMELYLLSVSGKFVYRSFKIVGVIENVGP